MAEAVPFTFAIPAGRVHVSVINRRKCCQSAMRVQGHYGRRVVVRKHTSPSVIAPIDAFHRRCEDGIMTGHAAPREHAMVRSRNSVENRPFLCQPPMSQSSFYAGPLTQFYGEWKLSCLLTEWVDRTLGLGYSLQVCSVPPPFR